MAADFRAARPEKAARELVIVVHLYPVGDAALTSPSRSLESVIGVARESKALSLVREPDAGNLLSGSMSGMWQRAMVEPLRHHQSKEAATDLFSLQPPRHISTLPVATNRDAAKLWSLMEA
jgi:hypothetical protein